jgi:hypothetical protein
MVLLSLTDLYGGQKGHGPPNSIQIYITILSINLFLPCKIWNFSSWPPQLLANVFWPLLQCWSRSATDCYVAITLLYVFYCIFIKNIIYIELWRIPNRNPQQCAGMKLVNNKLGIGGTYLGTSSVLVRYQNLKKETRDRNNFLVVAELISCKGTDYRWSKFSHGPWAFSLSWTSLWLGSTRSTWQSTTKQSIGVSHGLARSSQIVLYKKLGN